MFYELNETYLECDRCYFLENNCLEIHKDNIFYLNFIFVILDCQNNFKLRTNLFFHEKRVVLQLQTSTCVVGLVKPSHFF